MPAPDPDLELTGAELAAVSILAAGAATILPAYLVYRAGLTVAPYAILPFALLAPALCVARFGGRARWHAAESAAAGVVFAGVFGWLLWMARPDLLPLGGGPDLTHHLILIDHIAQHWRSVSDPEAVARLREMAHYTPGSHLLIALAGAWTRAGALQAVQPILALTVALKSVLVLLIALRLLPHGANRVPLAVVAVLLLFLPLDYFIGSFAHDSFWAQVVAEVFACGMWWALVVGDAHPSRSALVLFGIAGATAFIVWPIWVGPPVVTIVALAGLRRGLSMRERTIQLAIGLAPLAVIAVIHAAGQLGYTSVAATSAAVMAPSAGAFSWPFLVLSAIGLPLAATRREGRATALFIGAIAAQAGALFVLAKASGADTPYMAFKMMYLTIYPLAVVGGLSLAEIARQSTVGRRQSTVAWTLVAALAALGAREAALRPRPRPAVTKPVYEAGVWARAHTDPACVDYLVVDNYAAYWLHIAVLENARTTARSTDDETYEPKRAVIRWIQPDGLGFAIAADFDALPKDIRDNVDVLQRFGPAAVIKRRGRTVCP